MIGFFLGESNYANAVVGDSIFLETRQIQALPMILQIVNEEDEHCIQRSIDRKSATYGRLK
jgi:hypothetical protein